MLLVYVSTTSLKGIPSGSNSTARCFNTSGGTCSVPELAPGRAAPISQPCGSGVQTMRVFILVVALLLDPAAVLLLLAATARR